MLNKNVLESFESIKSKYSLSETDFNRATESELNQIARLRVAIEKKKDDLLKKALQNMLKEQEEFFKYKVIPTEGEAIKFIEHYAKAFFTEYKLGKVELKDAILYSCKSARIFESLAETYPSDIRWVLEYISGIKNGLVANASGTFIRERLILILEELGVVEVLVERKSPYEYEEWIVSDYGSDQDGTWYTETRYETEILLLKKHEFETLSKFDTGKRYELLSYISKK